MNVRRLARGLALAAAIAVGGGAPAFPTAADGTTLDPHELAFFSWFYHQRPSLGVNGWYSSNGTFTTPADKCP
jgi:hypothetical protein